MSLFLTKISYCSVSLICDNNKYNIKQKKFKGLSTCLNIVQLNLENGQIKSWNVLAIINRWVRIIYVFIIDDLIKAYEPEENIKKNLKLLHCSVIYTNINEQYSESVSVTYSGN